MKKLILLKLTCFILILNTNLYAQEFKFGLVGGLDLANSRLTNKPNIYSRVYYPMISFNINGFVGYKSAGFWGISLEPGYIQKGGVQQYNKEDKDDDVRFQMNYLQLPLLVDFYLGKKFSISVGPEFAYLISVKVKSKDLSNDISNFYDNNFEISGNIGINYNIHKHFDIGLRYNLGLTYTTKIIWSEETGIPIDESKEYNQYFQFLVRFKI